MKDYSPVDNGLENSPEGERNSTTAPVKVDFAQEVLSIVDDLEKKNKKPCAPLGVLAYASVVYNNCIKVKNPALFDSVFEGCVATVPLNQSTSNPHYHSVVGTKLYLVDWLRFFPELELSCPTCGGNVEQKWTNYSHNKSLFTIFNMNGPPSYAMVMNYKCVECKRTVHGNDGDLLNKLPEYVASMYQVESKYAQGDVHVAKMRLIFLSSLWSCTLMVTCAADFYTVQSTRATIRKLQTTFLCVSKRTGSPKCTQKNMSS